MLCGPRYGSRVQKELERERLQQCCSLPMRHLSRDPFHTGSMAPCFEWVIRDSENLPTKLKGHE